MVKKEKNLVFNFGSQKENVLTLIVLFEDPYMWIGLHDRDDDGVYRYISTGSLSYIYDLWDKDQPWIAPQVVTQAKKNGKWSIWYGNRNKLYSVCEK